MLKELTKIYFQIKSIFRNTFLFRKTVACPIVDSIDWNNYEHTDIYGNTLFRGIWEWGFLYKESEVPPLELNKHKQKSEPYW